MRVIYMGRKPVANESLKYLIKKNIQVVVVVGPTKKSSMYGNPRLIDLAESFNIPTTTDSNLYDYINAKNSREFEFELKDIDLLISMLFWKKIKKPLLQIPRIGCVNFHPAPLPVFRGFAPYSFGIYENVSRWGVSAHFISESFDTGDIINIRGFRIDSQKETAYSLEQKTQDYLLEQFKYVIDKALNDDFLPRKQQGKGRYFSKNDFEKLRKIQPEDSINDIERKIRAFWYPPYPGASIEVKGKDYTLINQELLKQIGEMYHESNSLP